MSFKTATTAFRAIIYKEIFTTYTNRNFVLLILVTPMVLAALFGAASSSLNSSGAPSLHAAVAIVNRDEGNGNLNFGQLFETSLIPASANENPLTQQNISCDQKVSDGTQNDKSLVGLIQAVRIDNAEAARQGVERGDFVAAIIIPPDFSRKISYTPTHQSLEPVAVEVYANSGNPVPASLVRSIAEAITNEIVAGNVTIAATLQALQEHFGPQGAVAALNRDFLAKLACAFTPSSGSIQLERQYTSGARAGLDFFTYIASGQAMFFLLFVALRGATDFLNERQQGTLQRLIVAPIPRYIILLGKLCGTLINCLIQLVLLYIALSVVGLALKGTFRPIWGSDVIGIGLVMLAASFAASGVGMLVMSSSRSSQQADAIAGLLTTFLAALGGAFFPVQGVPGLNLIAKLSPVYWGSDAFYRLASGQGNIIPNLLCLILIGAVTFGSGIWLFVRRQEA